MASRFWTHSFSDVSQIEEKIRAFVDCRLCSGKLGSLAGSYSGIKVHAWQQATAKALDSSLEISRLILRMFLMVAMTCSLDARPMPATACLIHSGGYSQTSISFLANAAMTAPRTEPKVWAIL
jgi:hypothetical protein